MKYGIKCQVDSLTEIGKDPMQITFDGIECIMEPSKEGFLQTLTIITKIELGQMYISKLVSSPFPGTPSMLTVDVDQQVTEKLENFIEYIDATLSFFFELKQINLNEAEHFFIPETEEEQHHIDVPSFSVKNREYPQQPQRLSAMDFRRLFQKRSIFEPFKLVCLFHKEGVQEFSSHRYIQAFYNFYFVLEDLYGEGKTNNNQIAEKFTSSQTLRNVVQNMLNSFIQGEHLANIQAFLTEEKLPFNIDGILKLIIQVRGNLHHFSRKSSKRKGTPLNQEDFRSIAFLLMGLSRFCLTAELFKDEEKESR